MDERVAFFKIGETTAAHAAVVHATAANPSTTASSPFAEAAKAPSVSAPKRAVTAARGGPVGRMQSALAVAIKDKPEWEEF
jgi:hypothetical protein